MDANILLFGLMMVANLYFARKKQGRMRMAFYLAAALWGVVGAYMIFQGQSL